MPRSAVLFGVRIYKAAFGWKIKMNLSKESVFCWFSSFPQPAFPFFCQSPGKIFHYWMESFEAERKEPVFLRRRWCSGSHPPGLRRAAAGARRALRTAHTVGSAAVLRGRLGLLGRRGGSGRNNTTSTSTTTTCGGGARGGVKTLCVFTDLGHLWCHNVRMTMRCDFICITQQGFVAFAASCSFWRMFAFG